MPRGDRTGPDGEGPRQGLCRNLGKTGGTGGRNMAGGHSKRGAVGPKGMTGSRTTKRGGTWKNTET